MLNSYGTILNVEDKPLVREKVGSYLEDNGFTVYVAENEQDALEIFREKKPDLVLSELQLSSMGGFQLLTTLKRESPETPVIVMSANSVMQDAIEALRLGASDYIVEPDANLGMIEHAVCRALERARLVSDNKRYRGELEKKNIQLSQSLSQLKNDQEAGNTVQQQLLPEPRLVYDRTTFSYEIIPSLYLSGDFVDYFKIDENKVGFYIADVSGHGSSSAFVTVLLNGLMDKILTNSQQKHNNMALNPDAVLQHINENIYNAKLGKYLTMFYGVMDLKENALRYSIGGHYPNPIISDGKTTQFLEGEGFMMGVVKNAKFKTYYYKLPEKFSLSMFSDGIFEMLPNANLLEKELKLLNIISHCNSEVTQILKALGMACGAVQHWREIMFDGSGCNNRFRP